jgi:hypothetical protein
MVVPCTSRTHPCWASSARCPSLPLVVAPQDFFHLPLAGVDVDIKHMPDQAPGLPPQHMGSAAAAAAAGFGQSGPMGMPYGSGGYSYEPADGAGPLGGREARRRSIRRQSSAGSSSSSMLAAPASAAGGMSVNGSMLAAAPAGADYEGSEAGLLSGSRRHRSSKGYRSYRPTDAPQSEV